MFCNNALGINVLQKYYSCMDCTIQCRTEWCCAVYSFSVSMQDSSIYKSCLSIITTPYKFLTMCVGVCLPDEPVWNTFRKVCWKSNLHTLCTGLITSTKVPLMFSFGCSSNAIWSSSWRWVVLNSSCCCSRSFMRPTKGYCLVCEYDTSLTKWNDMRVCVYTKFFNSSKLDCVGDGVGAERVWEDTMGVEEVNWEDTMGVEEVNWEDTISSHSSLTHLTHLSLISHPSPTHLSSISLSHSSPCRFWTLSTSFTVYNRWTSYSSLFS